MAEAFQITATQPFTYLDQNKQLVNGYRVFFFIPEFNENHEVHVPSLDKVVVKAAIDKIFRQRKDLSTL
jgi:hypothetical protein